LDLFLRNIRYTTNRIIILNTKPPHIGKVTRYQDQSIKPVNFRTIKINPKIGKNPIPEFEDEFIN
jgi:hypothetical protein